MGDLGDEVLAITDELDMQEIQLSYNKGIAIGAAGLTISFWEHL